MSGKRILVIDDEDDIREIACLSVETLGGWEALPARTGCEGLALALAELPDAILLDVMMPEMDGPTTFQRLRAHRATRSIPVVMLTAKVRAEDRQHLTHLGVDAVLPKPFDPVRLPGQIASALGWTGSP